MRGSFTQRPESDSALLFSGDKEKKEWKTPKINILELKETRGGEIPVGFEGPFNFIFGES